MKQYDIILKAMIIDDKYKVTWTAKDFQKEPYFVGYEASARMSELAKMYPDLIITGKDGRFRTLSINWDCKDINNYLEIYIDQELEKEKQKIKNAVWNYGIR